MEGEEDLHLMVPYPTDSHKSPARPLARNARHGTVQEMPHAKLSRSFPRTINIDEATAAALGRRLARVNVERAERGQPPRAFAEFARAVLAQVDQLPDAVIGGEE